MKLFKSSCKVKPPREIPPAPSRISKGSYVPPALALKPPKLMKINSEQVLDRASVIFKNKIEEKYKKSHPDLDMDKVELILSNEMVSLVEAIVEVINSK